MARYKLSATAVLLQVCRLSAEANGPMDLLHRVNDIDDQHMAGRVGAHHRTSPTATVTATRMYRGNSFVDPSEYSDGEAVSLTPVGGHNAPNAAGDGDRNRMRARRMERIRAKTRTEPANGKTTNSAGRKRRRFRKNNAHDAYDETANHAMSKPLDLDPIDIGDSINSTISSTSTNSTANPPPTLPRGTINSTPDIDSDPTADQDPELDRFRTDHIFDPHYNRGDVIEVENEMRGGGAQFEYDETVDVDFSSIDFSIPFLREIDSPSRKSGKKSKSSSSAAAAGSSSKLSKSSKSSKPSEVGGDDDDNDDESPNSSKSSKNSRPKRSSKPSEVGGGDDDNDDESPKSSKSSKNSLPASREKSRRQRYRALWKNGRNLRGDGEVDEDRMAALREEEDPSLQGVVAVIAAHQRREDRQRQKKLQRRRNRTPEEKARDRALATSTRRR